MPEVYKDQSVISKPLTFLQNHYTRLRSPLIALGTIIFLGTSIQVVSQSIRTDKLQGSRGIYKTEDSSDLGTPSSPNSLMSKNLSSPIYFEENRGQASSAVRFVSRGRRHTLTFDKTGAHFQFSMGTHNQSDFSLLPVNSVGPTKIIPSGELASRSNFLKGKDPAKWQIGVKHYSRIRYEGIYPGIDLDYYGTREGQLEYDFIVAPRVSSEQIALRLIGASKGKVLPDGDMLIELNHAKGGHLIQKKPIVYQETSHGREMVDANYRMIDDTLFGFTLGEYDRDRPLIIDPILSYSTYFGGIEHDEINGVAINSTGEIFITGYTVSTDFPLEAALDSSLSGSGDVFISKFNASGDTLILSTYIGGDGFEIGEDIAIDSDNNIYVVGETGSTNFPTSASAFDNTSGGQNDAFALKLSADGSSLIYSTYLGGLGTDRARGAAVDGSGKLYITGETVAGDATDPFPTTLNAFQAAHPDIGNNAFDSDGDGVGDSDSIWLAAFLTVLDTGGQPTYSSFLGGPQGAFFSTGGNKVKLGPNGTVYIVGLTSEPGFPATVGAYDTSFNDPDWPNPNEIPISPPFPSPDPDAFVARFDVTQSGADSLLWATFLGGGGSPTGSDVGNALTVDSAGNVYVTGESFSEDFPTTSGAFQETSSQAGGFVSKLSADGSTLLFSTFLSGDGGSYFDFGQGIALDSNENVVVTGFTGAFDFPTKNPLQPFLLSARFNSANPYGRSAFVAKLLPDGSDLVFSTYLGGCGSDEALGLVLDSQDNAIIVGKTTSADFPIESPYQQSLGNPESAFFGDGFLSRISQGASDDFADLRITMTPPTGTLYVGRNLPFTLTVTNHGPAVSGRVAVRQYVDRNRFMIVSATPSKGNCSVGCLQPLREVDSDPAVTCNLGDLALNETATITVTLKALQPGAVGNEAMVYSQTTGDPLTGAEFFPYDARTGNNVARANINPLASLCGNNVVDDGEECDDGNTIDGDGCDSTCLMEILPTPTPTATATPTNTPTNTPTATASPTLTATPTTEPVAQCVSTDFSKEQARLLLIADEILKSIKKIAGSLKKNSSKGSALAKLVQKSLVQAQSLHTQLVGLLSTYPDVVLSCDKTSSNCSTNNLNSIKAQYRATLEQLNAILQRITKLTGTKLKIFSKKKRFKFLTLSNSLLQESINLLAALPDVQYSCT